MQQTYEIMAQFCILALSPREPLFLPGVFSATERNSIPSLPFAYDGFKVGAGVAHLFRANSRSTQDFLRARSHLLVVTVSRPPGEMLC